MQASPDIATVQQQLRALGARALHEQHLLRRWLQARPLEGGKHDPADFLPRALLDALPVLRTHLAGLARLRSEHPAPDGGARLLVDLADGQSVEATLLPKDGLCVSTQVGCAVGCRFCMSGRDGLQRQLGSAEILAQVALARSRRPVRKVVFMGIGEPSHNLDNVLAAIELLGTLGGIGHKELVFSTVGDERVFERLPQGHVKPALALSLHTLNAQRRAELLPRAPQLDPAWLVQAADDYARNTGYPVQLQWTLLAGVNDGDDELQALLRLLPGRRLMLNLIPFNRVDGVAYQRPEWDHAAEFTRRLNRGGVLTRLRRSAAQEVDGGCGQLRARDAVARGAAARVVPLAVARP